MEIQFEIHDNLPDFLNTETIYLINDNWNDWYEFETAYVVNVYHMEKTISLGRIKIGQQQQADTRASLPKRFSSLDKDFFSIGFGTYYYEQLKKYPSYNFLLISLNDIAFNLDIYENFKNERVLLHSLLRDISITTLKGQWHRLAHGGALLTNYNFSYILPEHNVLPGTSNRLEFIVDIQNRYPPSNIHVLIGKNGIGKTTILKNMIKVLENSPSDNQIGEIDTLWAESFSNIVNISFSAFDMPILREDLPDTIPIKYTYVGLIKSVNSKKSIKSIEQLTQDFFEKYYSIVNGVNKTLWNNAIEILESDYTFQAFNINNWCQKNLDEIAQLKLTYPQSIGENAVSYRQRIDKQYFESKITHYFTPLSSGHKNILLILATLINLVEEKTLVIMDEPEEHLHPPLVSALIRALSNLLTYRNGVAIIATHSPVIVQEVPKRCVWILNRIGNLLKLERPEFETFGENLGELTSVIFGYEVLNSGFHKMLADAASKHSNYDSALEQFHNQLGKEAKAILKSYIHERSKL